MHWPDKFFANEFSLRTFKAWIKIALIQSLKWLHGTRFIWVAHNARPHESTAPISLITRIFLKSLDGIIYLSHYSHSLVHDLYGSSVEKAELITVHGHYLENKITPLKNPPSIMQDIHLSYFGRIRRYKNIHRLVALIGMMSDRNITLTITGTYQCNDLAIQIENTARSSSHIQLDMRSTVIPDADLESVIDNCHAVILPYRDILNSGAALLALSRNRPILAPAIGGFLELQKKAGSDWVRLYHGELTLDVFEAFVKFLRERPLLISPDLSAYNWTPISNDLCHFIHQLCDSGAPSKV